MEALEYRVENAEKRLDSHGDKLDTLTKCLERLTALEDATKKDLDDHEERLRGLEGHGSDMWDRVISAALGAIVSGVVVYALTATGLQ